MKIPLLDLFFPLKCAGCAQPLRDSEPLFCASCQDRTRPVSSPLCPACGDPLGVGSQRDSLCGDCLTEHRPFRLSRSLFLYEGPVREAIHRLKYQKGENVAPALAVAMKGFLSQDGTMGAFDVVVPIPLHPHRLRERRFNPAQLLARAISRGLNVPCDPHSLQRVRETLPQVELPRRQRLQNVKGAFKVASKGCFRGRRVLLIDDVWTTGATSQACARAIRQGGAVSVDVLTLARSAPDFLTPPNLPLF
ncbi:MAG: ComF family protein [Deltaproteobacteria bacterium]|nr:ComF family protein [Deltaproteobacteria bacterium]